jgi:hypothetical protein
MKPGTKRKTEVTDPLEQITGNVVKQNVKSTCGF